MCVIILFITFFFSVHERSEWSLMFELYNYLSGILLPQYLACFPVVCSAVACSPFVLVCVSATRRISVIK